MSQQKWANLQLKGLIKCRIQSVLDDLSLLNGLFGENVTRTQFYQHKGITEAWKEIIIHKWLITET